MSFLYDIVVFKAEIILRFTALFNKKINLFVKGRKESFSILDNNISNTDKVIWMHCASLGEFEQGRPILEKLRIKFPTYKLVLTFFSPSGYEVRKDFSEVDVVCYLPLDSKNKARKFLNIVHPELAIFVKYEFWPNLLNELKSRKIKTILVSGIFRKNQVIFKRYGSWLKKSLEAFTTFFVQDKNSEKLLMNAGFKNVVLSGDTRFDRVYEITQQNNQLSFISKFKNDSYTLVAGSTWKEDEDLLVEYINKKAGDKEKFIIAPHNINDDAIIKLKESIQKKTVLFSEKDNVDLSGFQVFIIDTIGILTKIFSYANIAYVGGGYTKSGVHNVLEPATFGVPVIIGPNYRKFNEAIDLVENEGCFAVDNYQKLSVLLEQFFQDKKKRTNAGSNALNYVLRKKGATATILKDVIK